jgi:hypothetical protein
LGIPGALSALEGGSGRGWEGDDGRAWRGDDDRWWSDNRPARLGRNSRHADSPAATCADKRVDQKVGDACVEDPEPEVLEDKVLDDLEKSLSGGIHGGLLGWGKRSRCGGHWRYGSGDRLPDLDRLKVFQKGLHNRGIRLDDLEDSGAVLGEEKEDLIAVHDGLLWV